MRFIFLLFICLYAISASGQKISTADSTWFAETADKVNQSINADPERADVLAKEYFYKAKALHNDEYTGKGACLVHMGIIMLHPEQAKDWYDTAQLYLKRSDNYLWNGYLNLNYGIILCNKYIFESGIGYLNKSIHYFEQAKDTPQLAYAYSNIAHAFHDFGDYNKGKEYAQKGLHIIEASEGLRVVRWWLLNALGINYDDHKEYEQAIATHLKALHVATGNDLQLCTTSNNLGNTYKKKGQLANAEIYFHQSLSYAIKLQDNYQFATIYGNLGDLALKQKKYTLARKYLDSCLHYSEASGSPEKRKDAYEYNATLFEKTGDFSNSVHFLRQYIALKDSLDNVAKAGIIYDAQERYETAKKEKQNQDLQAANQLKTIEKNRAVAEKKIIVITAVVLFLFLAVLAYLLYHAKLSRIKRSEDKKMNQALFIGEQNERIRIARDLHDSVGQMLSLVKMNLSAGEQNPENKKLQDIVDQTISEVRNISHNLIPEDLHFGLFPAVQSLAEKVSSSGNTKMTVHIDEPILHHQFEKENELSMYRIVQEVIHNMVRHSGANSIEVNATLQSQKILFSIRDNGKGMDTESIGSSGGIGWKNIQARVNLLDGEMKVQSEQLTGTQIIITLPQNG
ncbi:tetratricopeptide repeat-containing sensor histidine kinase [Edaphocola aurantiacus]|uniref:tetratricopeptide repeat-containing sensor histidine kinase n=1 Tax=Edaphocola aurantiacus TaxID=2601682 RepID=UPI001C987BF8|nr:tetratricopeptide repeat protein [Edaphocola aurantiacus]